MSKYEGLTDHLRRSKTDRWTASFAEIERLIDGKLPQSAKYYPAWWANQNRAQSLAWESVGWRTAGVDLERRTATFEKLNSDRRPTMPRKITIAEAKAGLAANFGVPVDSIEISIRG